MTPPADVARALASIRHAALTAPEHVVDDTGRILAEALSFDPAAPDACAAALGAVSAVLYARPHTVGPAVVRRVAAILGTPEVPAPIVGTAARILEVLETTPLGEEAWRTGVEVL